MRVLITLIIISIVVTSCTTKTTKDAATQFAWLVGDWRGVDSNGVSTESWKVNAAQLVGSSSTGTTDSTLQPFETVTLVQKDTTYMYIVTSATNKSEAPVPFTITNFTDSSFIAENPQHDYPKRIAYSLVQKDAIVAYIDDGKVNSTKRFYFNYTKVKK